MKDTLTYVGQDAPKLNFLEGFPCQVGDAVQLHTAALLGLELAHLHDSHVRVEVVHVVDRQAGILPATHHELLQLVHALEFFISLDLHTASERGDRATTRAWGYHHTSHGAT